MGKLCRSRQELFGSAVPFEMLITFGEGFVN